MTTENTNAEDLIERIYQEILRLRSEGGAAALATVVKAVGSTPGKALFKMLVYENGKILGTVGGGTFESKVISEALEAIKTHEPRLFDFKFSSCEGGLTDDQPICGGEMRVFIEPISVKPHLFIMGAGHIGQELTKIGKMLGFRVTVVDDREEYVSRERFPDADELLQSSFSKVANQISVDQFSYIIVVTRGHQHDKEALKAVIKSKATYIGMIGSKKKVKEVFERLIDEGIEKKLLEKVHAPIGLDIGSQTPAEIAVSIVAEIVAHKYGKDIEGQIKPLFKSAKFLEDN